MDKKIIKIIITVVLILTVAFGIFWVVKNKDIVSTTLQKVKINGGVSEEDSFKSKLLAQLKEKESQYEKIADQIASVQNTCAKVDLEKVGKKQIDEVGKENFTQTVGGYYTCEAVKNNNIDRCDFLKDVSDELFKSCLYTAVNLEVASEKCSDQSMSQCTQSGLSQSDCNNICSLYYKSDASVCSVIKDPALNKGCLAFAQKNVSLCNGIVDEFEKKSCVSQYYLYSAIRSNDVSLLNKMADDFKKSLGKVIFDENISCKEEFSKFIQEADCASGLVSNFEDIQRQADTLKQEIEELNRKIQGL